MKTLPALLMVLLVTAAHAQKDPTSRAWNQPVPPFRITGNGNPKYPNIVEDYRRQFKLLRSLQPSIFLASHGNFFDLENKRKRHGAVNAFVDPEGYRKFVAVSEERFEKMVAEQQRVRAGTAERRN